MLCLKVQPRLAPPPLQRGDSCGVPCLGSRRESAPRPRASPSFSDSTRANPPRPAEGLQKDDASFPADRVRPPGFALSPLPADYHPSLSQVGVPPLPKLNRSKDGPGAMVSHPHLNPTTSKYHFPKRDVSTFCPAFQKSAGMQAPSPW